MIERLSQARDKREGYSDTGRSGDVAGYFVEIARGGWRKSKPRHILRLCAQALLHQREDVIGLQRFAPIKLS